MAWSTDYPHHGSDWPYSRKIVEETMLDACPADERYGSARATWSAAYGLPQSLEVPA